LAQQARARCGFLRAAEGDLGRADQHPGRRQRVHWLLQEPRRAQAHQAHRYSLLLRGRGHHNGQGDTERLCNRRHDGGPDDEGARQDQARPALWRSGGSAAGRGAAPQLWTAHPPGAPPKYPDPGQQGNDPSESQGDRICSGAGFFSRGFPNPPTSCLNFSLWRDSSVWRIWGGYFSRWRSGWGGVC